MYLYMYTALNTLLLGRESVDTVGSLIKLDSEMEISSS